MKTYKKLCIKPKMNQNVWFYVVFNNPAWKKWQKETASPPRSPAGMGVKWRTNTSQSWNQGIAYFPMSQPASPGRICPYSNWTTERGIPPPTDRNFNHP